MTLKLSKKEMAEYVKVLSRIENSLEYILKTQENPSYVEETAEDLINQIVKKLKSSKVSRVF